ncbi:spp-12 [Pristionchus pacificus]|uniref:Saposin B-type domain-containing protein n=1 Tax=Pristionchus pacificus TaxID=54126 RepID=A0A454XKA4_PRIPA|nr:spp-12 [Pristionchus pacificus]|eukprot:PDM68575.1 hypothetical protein PRIPAC_44077 [Pristionchus pacificus]
MRSLLCLFAIVTLAASTAIRVEPQQPPVQPVVQTGEAGVKDGLLCNACKDIVDDVENHEEDTIEARVDASIKEHCNNLGFLAGRCIKDMTEVEDIIVQNINENYSADQICQMADIC